MFMACVIIRFLILNYITKVLFTTCTFIIFVATKNSDIMLDFKGFPWYLIYILCNRAAVIATSSTFLFMSLAKVILNCRMDLYIKINSDITVNLATLLVLLLNLVDFILRIHMHVFNDCEDKLMFKLYQVEFKWKFQQDTINVYNNTNSTHFEEFGETDPIGCRVCPSYPTLRIIMAAVLVLETMKLLSGFYRIMKKYGTKVKETNKNHTTVTIRFQQGKQNNMTMLESCDDPQNNNENQAVEVHTEDLEIEEIQNDGNAASSSKEVTDKILFNNFVHENTDPAPNIFTMCHATQR